MNINYRIRKNNDIMAIINLINSANNEDCACTVCSTTTSEPNSFTRISDYNSASRVSDSGSITRTAPVSDSHSMTRVSPAIPTTSEMKTNDIKVDLEHVTPSYVPSKYTYAWSNTDNNSRRFQTRSQSCKIDPKNSKYDFQQSKRAIYSQDR